MTTITFGWDLSHFDVPGIGDAVAEGFRFFTHKAGGDANDTEIGTWWSKVKGLSPDEALLGAYWVLYPGNPSGRADAFLARLDATCKGWRDRPFMLQVDCEKWNGDSGTVPSKADIKSFCDRLHAKMPKLKPIVYAPQWVYGNQLTGLGYPLWASAYVSGSGAASKLYPGDSSSKWDAYSGQVPAILQFTSSATIAGQTTCDANAFRGTLAELTALVAPGWDIDMPLTPADGKTIWQTDIIPNPSFRTDAKTNEATTAYYAMGDIWNRVGAIQTALAAQSKTIAALASKDDVDENQIITGILAGLGADQLAAAFTAAGLTPDALAAAIPADIAQQVVDALGQRISAGA
jgi:hypothetical protein